MELSNTKSPIFVSELTKEKFDTEIQKGLDSVLNGKVYTSSEIEEEIKRIYGI